MASHFTTYEQDFDELETQTKELLGSSSESGPHKSILGSIKQNLKEMDDSLHALRLELKASQGSSPQEQKQMTQSIQDRTTRKQRLQSEYERLSLLLQGQVG
jgi:hypothetical protein